MLSFYNRARSRSGLLTVIFTLWKKVTHCGLCSRGLAAILAPNIKLLCAEISTKLMSLIRINGIALSSQLTCTI